MANINDLPAEILLSIFRECSVKTITNAARFACVKWNVFCKDQYVWKDRELSCSAGVDFEDFVTLCDFDADISQVRKVDWEGCEHSAHLSDRDLLKFSQRTSRLHTLRLESELSVESAVVLAENNPGLEVIQVTCGTTESWDAIEILASGCKDLKQLTLFQSNKVPDARPYFDVLQLCPNLEKFDFGLDAARFCSGQLIREIAVTCTHLTELNLSECLDLCDDTLAAVTRSLPNLTCLYMMHCGSMSDQALSLISHGLPQLKDLRLGPSETIATAEAVSHLSRLRHLQRLGLYGCCVQVAAMERIAAGCPDLYFLDLQDCVGINDAVVYAIVSQFGSLKRLYLDFYGNPDIMLRCVATNGLLLETLSLQIEPSSYRTGWAVRDLVSKLSRHQLENLSVKQVGHRWKMSKKFERYLQKDYPMILLKILSG